MSVYFGKFLSFGSNPENWKSTLHNLVGKITKQFQVIINVWRIFYQLFDNFVRRHFNKSTWDEFCEQTHIHGLKFVSNIDYYLFERHVLLLQSLKIVSRNVFFSNFADYSGSFWYFYHFILLQRFVSSKFHGISTIRLYSPLKMTIETGCIHRWQSHTAHIMWMKKLLSS